MRKSKHKKRGISFGTLMMLACTAAVLIGFAALIPSFTGNQDILIDAARLAVAMDDSLSQLSASTEEILQNYVQPQSTYIPPFTSQSSLSAQSNSQHVPTAAVTPAPTPTVNPKRSFTLCAGGSVEVDSSVRKALTLNNELRLDLLTDQMKQQMQADLSIITLQNTISSSNGLSNVNISEDILKPIRAMGVNTINIGHANTLNYGNKGIDETIEAIKHSGIRSAGTKDPAVFSINGIQIALLHYQDKFSNTARNLISKEENIPMLAQLELEDATGDIDSARKKGAQVIVVTLGWGPDGKHTPSDEQYVLAQALADAGADIILGTGNGALQPVQVLSANRGDNQYHPVLCAYSLGNLFSPERDTRITLASILLKTKVVYDSAAQTVAFENLTYTPTYAWRGKDQGKTLQRILINDPENLPDFVDQNQQGVMQRCMTLVTEVMKDTTIPLSY